MIPENKTYFFELNCTELMKRFYWLLFIFAGISFSCKKQSDLSLIINVEDEFSLELWEELEPYNRTFQLKFSTFKKTFACTNYEIAFDKIQSGTNLFVNILDLIGPEDCLAGNDQAKGEVEFDPLDPGIYRIRINLKNEVSNEGILEVNQNFYQLSLEQQNGISLKESKLFRVPNGLIWGQIQTKDVQLLANFKKDIENITLPAEISEGNYGYFEFRENQITLPSEQELNESITFAYTIATTDIPQLKDLIKQYRGEPGKEIPLTIYTWQGIAY